MPGAPYAVFACGALTLIYAFVPAHLSRVLWRHREMPELLELRRAVCPMRSLRMRLRERRDSQAEVNYERTAKLECVCIERRTLAIPLETVDFSRLRIASVWYQSLKSFYISWLDC